MRAKYRQTAKLLTECLENMIEENPDVISSEKDYHLDLDKIKDAKNVEDINREDMVALVLVLLKQLQPFISDGFMPFQRRGSDVGRNSMKIEGGFMHKRGDLLNGLETSIMSKQYSSVDKRQSG